MSIYPNNLSTNAHLTFDDEFNTLNLWNGASGTWSTTFWYQDPNGNGATLASNGEQEWYINSNYAPTSSITPWTVNNGVLTLTAAPASSSIKSLINNYNYTSGEVNTYHSFAQTYGYFEMRAELPAGQGFWPAFWLLPESGAWPPELDIMEVLGNNTSMLYTTVHTAETGGHTQSSQGNIVADMASGYHTYGVDWEADYITWYFDGQAIYTVATPGDMHQPMYMVANLAAGGYWPGSTDGVSSAQMRIDYIRAYAAGADTTGATQALLASTAGTGGSVTAITSAEANVTLGAGITSVTLTGASAQTVTANNLGDVIFSNDHGNRLIGGTGNDVFHIGRAGDLVTGGAGADTFMYDQNPWGGSTITDFSTGDVLDLTPTLVKAGYTGSDPVGAGYVKIGSDSAGNAQIWFDPSGRAGASGWWPVGTLTGVAASTLTVAAGHITTTASSPVVTPPVTTPPVTTPAVTTPPVTTPPPVTTGGGSTTGASAVSTAAGAYTAGAGVTDITLTGASAQTVTGNNLGDTFHSNNNANHLIGGTGADTFYIGRAGDLVTGGGGNDVFVLNENPWWGGHITDFGAGDTLNLAPTLAKAGYTGSDPIGAGYLKIISDGAGNTQVHIDPNGHAGASGWWLAVTLDGVAASGLKLSGGAITQSGSTSTSGGSTTITGGAVGGTTATTAAASYTLGAGVTDITLTGGAAQTVTGNNLGDVFHSNNNANHLIGGTGNDTFYIGRAGDLVTGGGGNDTFVFNENPWWGGHITDFSAGDTLDLTPTLLKAGYTGSDPVGAGYVKIAAGVGESKVYIDPTGHAGAGNGWWLAVTLDGVSSDTLQLSGSKILESLLLTPAVSNVALSAAPVTTAAAAYVAGAGVTDITLNGASAQTVTGNNLGDVFHSNNNANHLIGGTGNDTFYVGRAGDLITGGGGNDNYVFNENPWWGGHITDFGAGDALNLTPTLIRAGYSGSDPIGAGFVKIGSDSAGNAQVFIDPTGHAGVGGGWWLAVTLDGEPAANLHATSGWITG